jgi:hypothetical protein
MPMTFERSPDTDAVILALRGCNNEISYRDLARQSGLTLGRAKQVLGSARRALRSDKILFGIIRGEGLRRLTDSDKVKKPEAFKKRVFRGAGRELKDLSTIANFGALEKSEQNSCTINRTVLNVLRQQARVIPETPKSDIAPQPMANVSQLIKARAKV